jgi:hypothetical protein
MAQDPIRREIIKAFGLLDAPPELLDTVTEAARKQLSRAATELGANRDLVYILDCWADESLPDHEVLARLEAASQKPSGRMSSNR